MKKEHGILCMIYYPKKDRVITLWVYNTVLDFISLCKLLVRPTFLQANGCWVCNVVLDDNILYLIKRIGTQHHSNATSFAIIRFSLYPK